MVGLHPYSRIYYRDGGSVRQSREIIKHWIDSINDEGRNLTDWEKRFMESITDQFELIGSLSQKQEEILERIYIEKVP